MIKSRRMRWAEMEENKNAYRRFLGKPEGKRPLGRPSCMWVGWTILKLILVR
jgi:hypothetical protein